MRMLLCTVVIAAALVACDRPAAGKPEIAQAASATPTLQAGERRIAMSDGTQLYVKVAGKGPVCMLLHGGPGQGTRSTEKMGVDALEDFLTLVYVDQRGSGLSQDAGNYHLDRVVQDFEEVRQALGVDRMCLIAHSFGGILAVNYAQRHPEHVSKLILSNISLQFISPASQRMQVEFINRTLAETGRPTVALVADADAAALTRAHEEARQRMNNTPYGYTLMTYFQSSIEEMQRIDAYQRSVDYGRSVIRGRKTLPEYYLDYAPMTASIAQPTLVLAGSHDYAVGPDEHKRFRFPDQKVVVLDTGHMPYYDDNADFIAAIRDFMVGPAPALPLQSMPVAPAASR